VDELLTPRTVGAYLAGRGLVGAATEVEASELGGGVSNVVLDVRAGHWHAVVKQALPRLRVADEWLAKPDRAITEADAIRLLSQLTPGRVPVLLDADPDACALVIEHAPEGWTTWKEDLLAGRIEGDVAVEAGRILGVWHAATDGDPKVVARFDDADAFDQLRVDPYYRTVIVRRPEIAGVVAAYVDAMLATKRCLVHGDYSPKNVLCGPGGPWVVDFEVAHLGDPAFDVAFMLNHFMLKAIHTGRTSELERTAFAFVDAYDASASQPCDRQYVLGHTGCLMMARVDGKSPAEYLTERGRATARRIGAALICDPPQHLDDAWRLLKTP
jgi:tRNA A-37 threonylcarbamoyl transferase component Bud32